MPTRLSATERRAGILRAAAAVFAETNYRQAGVTEIARRAGVSEPLIYRHFPSKKALFLEILDRVGRRILEVWEEATAAAPDALAALRRAGEVYLENLHRHPAEAALQFQALAEAHDPDIGAVLRANHRAYLAFFENLIERGRREGVVRSDVDVRAAAWLFDSVGFSLTVIDLLDLRADVDDRRVGKVIGGLVDWLAAHDRKEMS